MRRVLIVTVRWVILALLMTGVWLLLPLRALPRSAGAAAVVGAVYATSSSLSVEVGRRLRRPAPDQLCRAAWRTYGGNRRGRWRDGRLGLVPGGVAAFTVRGRPGPRLDAGVAVLGERPVTLVEALSAWMGDRRVLELSAGGQRVDVAVDAADVPVVRRRLGHGSDGGESLSA